MTDREIEELRFYHPCTTMCRTKFILPNNCSAKMIVKNEKSRRPLFKYVR